MRYLCSSVYILLSLLRITFYNVYPWALITAWHRRRMLPISLRSLCWGSWAHSSMRASLSSRTVAGWTWREEMAFCSISHACSMGFKSGDLAGQSNCTIAACSRYRLVMRALCARALSSIRMKSGPIAPAYGRTWTSKISLTYLSAVSVPLSMTCRSVFPWALIPAHTITEPPP